MWIKKHGDPARTDRLIEFECPECGCEFVCGPHDIYPGNGGPMTYCPECGKLCERCKGRR